MFLFPKSLLVRALSIFSVDIDATETPEAFQKLEGVGTLHACNKNIWHDSNDLVLIVQLEFAQSGESR